MTSTALSGNPVHAAPCSVRTTPKVSKDGLSILLRTLGLVPDESKFTQDSLPTLVGIDFENVINMKHGFSESSDGQAGIAILDPAKLDSCLPSELISTYNFIAGSPSYIAPASARFIFGESTVVDPTEMLASIEAVMPKHRPLVLVGHSPEQDVQVLASLGYELPPDTRVIDTRRIAGEVLGTISVSLGSLLRRLKCPFDGLHSAGNDATFALRAALLLAARVSESQYADECSVLTAAATYPTSDRLIVLTKANKRAKKREKEERERQKELQKALKQMARARTDEERDEIRAERAARRREAEMNADKFWSL
ncbi:hypothetical protein B0I35DRAFT_426578 [Stachybotrys elegans]|uniref:Gfd2/YDR514C-like C-terminal domain-containing protein n=1 Tax=Stachybotrys elegans TaxID=80388 RepID=A0A8K0STY1_9HYPO|nr:hypothetical protein B0I35DRAFT_426578 [Stachybotrys elegans]